MLKVWHFGLFFFVLQSIANSVENEFSIEAVFQGHCGRASPCEQLCYELHDGMYECDCTEGYELDKNGYSCQEINSTYAPSVVETRAAEEEDVLYQKGASFSAKLDETNGHVMESPAARATDEEEEDRSMNDVSRTPVPRADQAEETSNMWNMGDQTSDNFYSKEDMSVYDDVNNNRLNLRNIRLIPDQNRPKMESPTTTERTGSNGSISSKSEPSNATTKSPMTISTTYDPRATCVLDCGSEGYCDNEDGVQRCLCPFERTGDKCNEEFQVNVARFTKRSWLAFPAFRGAYKHVQLHIEFRPEAFDGIILLTGERDDLTGDFMALLIHQGFIEFWFDCGSGTGKVRSEETVVLNQWNTVTIYRHRWDAWLVLNQGNRVQGRSKGLFSRITFREPVFLGGTGNITGLSKKLPVLDGLMGCVRKFVANDHEYNFKGTPFGDVTQGFDVQECVTDLCSRYPCKHAGKCLLSDQGAICLCPLGFGGDLCEMRLDLQVPSFNGSSYLRFAPLGDSALIWLELKIIIKPQREDGLILYSGHHEYGDYVALSLNMGHVEFTFDLGSGPATVRSDSPLQLGQWHMIKISRTARLAVLKIDSQPEVMTVSSNGFWHLSLPHSLFLGGVNNIQMLPSSLREKGSFIGCIQKVEINGRSLSIISEALGGSNIDNCPHACLARPCGPLAQCVPNLDTYECQCSPSNINCNKAEEVPLNLIESLIMRRNHSSSNNNRNKIERTVMDGTWTTTSTAQPMKINSGKSETIKASRKNVNSRVIDARQDDNNYDNNRGAAAAIEERKEVGVINRKVAVQDDDDDYYYYYEDNEDNNKTEVSRRDGEGRNGPIILNYEYSKVSTTGQTTTSTTTPSSTTEKATTTTTEFTLEFDERENLIEDADSGMAKKDADFNFNGRDYNDDEDDDDDDDYSDELDEDWDMNWNEDDFKIVLPPWRDEPKTTTTPLPFVQFRKSEQSFEMSPYAEDPFLKSREFMQDMNRIMKGKDVEEEQNGKLPPVNVQETAPASTTTKRPSIIASRRPVKTSRNHGACFTGIDSFFHYSDEDTMRRMVNYKVDINLRFKSRSKHGLLLWAGCHRARINDNFLSLGIESGYLHLRYNLGGSGPVNLAFNLSRVSDGLWHRVRVLRTNTEGSLEVDGAHPVVEKSPAKLRFLNTDAGLYVGGMPDTEYYTRRRYSSGIVGCISEVVLAGELRLNLDSSILGTAHNVDQGVL